jgi:hypothetical protein
MKYYYSLRINVEEEKASLINHILGVPSDMSESNWGIEKVVGDEDIAFDFIGYFLGILEDNYDRLEKIGVKRGDISIWMLYEYDYQCNMEFSPEKLLELGREGITLCISCWES